MVEISAAAIVILALILFLKTYHPETAVIVAAVSGAILLTIILIKIYSPLAEILKILEDYGVESQLTTYLLKAFGICYLTKFSSEICADFGQTSLSSKVELAGKTALFILTVPIIKSILNIGLSLIG